MKTARNLILMAYDDYIASRVLLNNKLALQGAIFASTAIEKYLKAILVVLGYDLNKIKFHLDRLPKLKSYFEETEYLELFTKYFDPAFFDQLSKAYSFRYYDNVKQPTTMGFFINQFLGELDYTVAAFERLVIMNDDNGKDLPSKYKRAVNEKDHNLFHDNYILNNLDKREFMERNSDGFGIYHNPNTQESYTVKSNIKMEVPYTGKIFIIEVEEK